jgi:hypothetical protein
MKTYFTLLISLLLLNSVLLAKCKPQKERLPVIQLLLQEMGYGQVTDPIIIRYRKQLQKLNPK